MEEPALETLPKQRRAKKYILRVFLALVFLAIVAAAVWLVSLERATTAPLRTSDAFIKSLLTKNPKAAYALTHDEFKQKTSEDDMTQVAETVSKGLKLDSLKVLKGEIEEAERGKLATVFYEIEGKDATYEMKIQLLHEKGKGWLIVAADNAPKQ